MSSRPPSRKRCSEREAEQFSDSTPPHEETPVTSGARNTNPDVELLSLHQYFMFANTMREDWLREVNAVAKPPAKADYQRLWRLPYVHYWYAGLWVVVEGWRQLGLHDDEVDRLLRLKNRDHLERYRNGIFHFQPDYWRRRHSGLITKA